MSIWTEPNEGKYPASENAQTWRETLASGPGEN